MDIRNFGHTDIKTSAVVFGGGFVGGILIDADDLRVADELERRLREV